MSLFENDEYRWRETYFVLFDAARRPSVGDVVKALVETNSHYELTEVRDADSKFESLTLISKDDNAAMDIIYIEGEEVKEQAGDLVDELRNAAVEPDQKRRLGELTECNARFDVFHFEHIAFDAELAGEDEEFMDPGSLLNVLQALKGLTEGIAVDPQAGEFV